MPNRLVQASRTRGRSRIVPALRATPTALAAVLASGLLVACGAGSPGTVAHSRGSPTTAPTTAPPGGVPIVAVVTQPATGQAGPVVAVDGTAMWVVPGHPGCAQLRTRHQPPQILSLVGDTADRQRHIAEAGLGPAAAHVRITGYVPPAAATVCGGLTFSVLQVHLASS